MNQIFGQRFITFKKMRYRDQLNSKHIKIAVNSATQYFEGYCQKKCLLKVGRFLVHPPQNRGSVRLLQN